MKEIAKGVFVETEYFGCNNGCIVTREGLVLTDPPQRPTDAAHWREEVRKLGEVRYLINTEHHGDHIAGNWFFKEARNIAHEGTRARFKDSLPSADFWRERVAQLDPKGLPLMKDYEVRLPQVTFTERMTLYLGGREIQLIHKKGHTESQAMVYLPAERALLPGDNIVENWPPFFHSGLGGEWLKTLSFIEGMEVSVILPGHGQVAGKEVIPRLRADIQRVMDWVRDCIKKGMGEEETAGTVRYIHEWDSIPSTMVGYYETLVGRGTRRLYRELGGRN